MSRKFLTSLGLENFNGETHEVDYALPVGVERGAQDASNEIIEEATEIIDFTQSTNDVIEDAGEIEILVEEVKTAEINGDVAAASMGLEALNGLLRTFDKRHGTETSYLRDTVSNESIGLSSGKRNSTGAGLEGIVEFLKGIGNAIWEAIKKLWNWITSFFKKTEATEKKVAEETKAIEKKVNSLSPAAAEAIKEAKLDRSTFIKANRAMLAGIPLRGDVSLSDLQGFDSNHTENVMDLVGFVAVVKAAKELMSTLIAETTKPTDKENLTKALDKIGSEMSRGEIIYGTREQPGPGGTILHLHPTDSESGDGLVTFTVDQDKAELGGDGKFEIADGKDVFALIGTIYKRETGFKKIQAPTMDFIKYANTEAEKLSKQSSDKFKKVTISFATKTDDEASDTVSNDHTRVIKTTGNTIIRFSNAMISSLATIARSEALYRVGVQSYLKEILKIAEKKEA